MAEDRELRESGLVIVEIIAVDGYQKGVQTTLGAREADAFAKAGKVKILGREKRLMNKLAPSTNEKSEVEAEEAEGDDKSDGADKKSGKSKKEGTK